MFGRWLVGLFSSLEHSESSPFNSLSFRKISFHIESVCLFVCLFVSGGSEQSKLGLEILSSVVCFPLHRCEAIRKSFYFRGAKIRRDKQYQTNTSMLFSLSSNRRTNRWTTLTAVFGLHEGRQQGTESKEQKERKAKLHFPSETCELWDTMLPRSLPREVKFCKTSQVTWTSFSQIWTLAFPWAFSRTISSIFPLSNWPNYIVVK